jgi:Tol biopolymer transport system component
MLSFFGQAKLAVSAGGGREEWEEKRIAVIDLETTASSYLTKNSEAAVCPAWSPDGTAIAYSAARGPAAEASVGGGEQAKRLLAQRRIWVTDATGTHAPRPLTSDSRYRDEEPIWSADGQHILFCRISADNSKSLWLMGADGADAVQLAGPLYINPGTLGVDDSWFGYYGYIEWSATFDWFRGS